MNILGLVFPASLFQQTNPRTSSEKDDLKTKYSSVADIFRTPENKTRETQGIKCQEHPSDNGCSKRSSRDLNERIGQLTDSVKAPDTDLILSHDDEPAKRTSKKKEKKKGKSRPLLQLDDNISSETADMSKILNGTEPVECDQSNATLCNPTIKKLISKSVHDKASESFLYSNKSDHFQDSADTECLISIKKSNSEKSVNKNVNGTHDIKFARNQEKSNEAIRDSSNMATFSSLEPSVCFKDSSDGCKSTEACEEGSDGYSFVMERSGVAQNEVAADNNSCLRSFLADSSGCCPGNLHKSLGANNGDDDGIDISASLPFQSSLGLKEGDKKYCNMEVTDSNQCSRVCHVPAVELFQDPWHDKRNSKISNISSSGPCYLNHSKKFGKENVNLTWQRTGRYIGSSQTDVRNFSDSKRLYVDAASIDTTSISKHSSSKEDGLLPTPDFSHYRKNWFQQKAKYSGIGAQKIHRTQGHVLVETRGIHARHGRFVARVRKDGFMETGFRSKNKLTPRFKEDNANHGRRGSWVSKSDLCKPGTREVVFNEMKSNDGDASIKAVKPELIHVSLVDEDKSSVCSGVELPYHSTTRVINSRVSKHKWIPVNKRDSESQMLNNSSGEGHADDTGEVNHNQGVDNEVHVASVALDMATGGKGSVRKDKNDCSFAKNLPVYICSNLAEKTLEASYVLQIVSESFQLATGSPVAEFEKLLYSASPVVVPSVFQQYSDKHEPSSASFSKILKPGIALRDVWNWYEGPGNFGLQVKAEDSQNSEGLEANASFNAHFVPFLSAVQLFGHPYHSFGNIAETAEDCSYPSSSVDISSVALVVEKSYSEYLSSKEHTRPCGVATSDGSGSLSTSSVCPSDDYNVIFEYFEHEPPQQRKPLFVKIKEILKFGASSSQIYGDPSKLECTDLRNLHPASWYSVAWYPIYRIPEGCFRASFLTYHSLGHLHLRCTKLGPVEENSFCVVSPALGMQSYNAQGECWFYPKRLGGRLQKGMKPFDALELLKQRLGTLEETAALFSRGQVYKDRIRVGNRHPDYEFFISRRH